jgi:hypothetical protein
MRPAIGIERIRRRIRGGFLLTSPPRRRDLLQKLPARSIAERRNQPGAVAPC